MDAKELMIGNLLYFNGGVSPIQGGGIMLLSEGRLNVVPKPIPLTEEWLLKFGFEYRTNINPNPRQIKYIHQKGGFHIEYMRLFYWNGGNTEIKHVHQLQNLYFSLTQTELKIK